MRRSGQKLWSDANPRPVATVSTEAARRIRRYARRGRMPTSSVSAAEPSRVPVTIVPTSSAPKPRRTRCPARRTLTRPSPKPRRARARRIRPASLKAAAGLSSRLRWASLLDPEHRVVWRDAGELAVRDVRAAQIEEAAHLEPPALQVGAQDRHLVHVTDLGRAERVASGSQTKLATAG